MIAIDDASTDDTSDVLHRWAAREPRIRVYRNASNLGHVGTMTLGLQLTRGRFVARIDPDDRYRPCFLEATVPRLEASESVGMVYGDAATINAAGDVVHAGSHALHGGKEFQGDELPDLLCSNFICAPTVIARREAWLGALPVPPHLAFNDYYFSIQIARRWNLCYVPEILADYRVHATNHHARIVSDRSEEASIMWLLDDVFAATETSLERERRKRAVRRRAYAVHYITMADKYFGRGLEADARRCYLRAVTYHPRVALRLGPGRRLLATFAGIERYDRSKAFARRLATHLWRVV